MSFQAQAWARAQKTGSAVKKAVLMAVANYADEDGICWPSQRQLAEDTELSESSILRALNELQAAGFLSREHRYGKNGYRTSDLIRLSLTVTQLPSSELPSRELPSSQTEPNCQPARAIREPSLEPSRSSNATRVAVDFFPSDKILRRCHSQLGMSEQDVEDEHLSFMDYFNRDGPKYRHSNWDITFWNWCKRSKRFGQATRRNSIEDGFAEIQRVIDQMPEGEDAGSQGGGGKVIEILPRLRQGTKAIPRNDRGGDGAAS